MPDPEISRLRRFCLGLALVVLTWGLAGVSLDPDAHIQPFGLPFRISRPDLLPLGLALGALYAMARYYYYALMLGPSPYRRRRDLLNHLVPEGGKRPVPTYWGHTSFHSTPWHHDHDRVEHIAKDLANAFPKFARARVLAEVAGAQSVDDEGEVYTTYAVAVTIPVRCRLAALFEDIDYTSPVWFTIGALAVLVIA